MRRVARWAVALLLLVTVPCAGALVAIRYAPPVHVEIAGQQVAVKPVIGQDTSRLNDGAVIRPEHTHVGVLDKDIGVDIDTDWNRLIPSDKPTRKYLAALWEDPEPQIARISAGARRYLVTWTLIGSGTGFACVAGTLLVLGRRRRKLASYGDHDARLVNSHNRRLRWAATVVALAAVAATQVVAVRTYLHDDHHALISSPIFAGTTLQGTEVDGLIGDILPFLSILLPRTTFYDTVAQHLETAIDGQSGLDRSGDEVVFVVAEDFEDVNGMARQVGLAAALLDADFIALSGDLTFAGKAIESYIIDTVDYYSGDRPVYFAPGLHDTDIIVRAAERRGWHIADGTTEDVNGLRLLAVGDPRISTVGNFGTDDVLRDTEVDVDMAVAEAIAEACDARPDFVVVHDHVLGRRIAEAGCQDQAVLDGRSYRLIGPQVRSTASGLPAIEFTSGSAGGHVTTDPDPGIVKNAAQFVAFVFDPETGATRYVVVTVDPDASVTLSPMADLTSSEEGTSPPVETP